MNAIDDSIRTIVIGEALPGMPWQSTPISPPSSPATGSSNGLYPKSKFLALIPSIQQGVCASKRIWRRS